MRTDTITKTVEVLWRDERKGRTTTTKTADVHILLTHYGLPPVIGLPFAVDNADFMLRCAETGFPCTITIERKPQGPVQEAAWAYVEESRMARIVIEDDQLGVRFLDEDRFVSFSHLTFDGATGFRIVESEQ